MRQLTIWGRSPMLALSAGLVGAAVLAGPVAADQVQLTASLSGSGEVPGPGDPNGTGTATFTVDTASGQICYQLNISGLSSQTSAAQLHHGDPGVAGESGAVTVSLAAPTNGSSSDCTTVDAGLAAAIANSPGAYYTNVYTTDFPQGAVRGQLAPASADHGDQSAANQADQPDHTGQAAPDNGDQGTYRERRGRGHR